MSRKPPTPKSRPPRVNVRGLDGDATQRAIDQLHDRLADVEDFSAHSYALSGSVDSVLSANYMLVRRQVLTSTTSGSSYSLSPGTRLVELEMVGGGGQGGAKFQSTVSTIGGGGASGMYVRTSVSSSAQMLGGNFQCGVAGFGVIAGTGQSGGDTVIVLDGRTYVAKGGLGGSGSVWTDGVARGGTRQSLTQAVDIQFQQEGDPGLAGDAFNNNAALFKGGAGGSNPLGAGGGCQYNLSAAVEGKHATGYGGGGGGATDSLAVDPIWGGSGSQGAILLYEYR